VLKFSEANAKTGRLNKVHRLRKWLKNKKKVYSLDLPAGHSCPQAKLCRSSVTKQPNGKLKLTDGPHCQFRCFSATAEVFYPTVYEARQHNFSLIKQAKTPHKIARLILDNLPPNCGILRYHVSGDFFSAAYFQAAIKVAQARPDVLFYGHTKNIPMLVKYGDSLPPNLRLSASHGGRYDHLIPKYNGPNSIVVFSEKEARKKHRKIDHDDSHLILSNKPFALLVHGIQPKGTAASKAVFALRRKGVNYSYSRKGNK